MKVIVTDTFYESLEKLIDADNPMKLAYWRDKWYSFKRAVYALIKYFRITTKMVPWDYSSILDMMSFQINTLANYIENNGIEVDKDRLPKIKQMRRFVELANEHGEPDNFKEEDKDWTEMINILHDMRGWWD